MILYFSGTGNSRYVAKKLAESTGEKLISLNEIIKAGGQYSVAGDKCIIFVAPTYAWRIPRVVEEWISQQEFDQGARAWFVMTCGSEIGNAGEYNKELCDKKNLKYMGTEQVVMPENYLAMFKTPHSLEAVRIISDADPKIASIGLTLSVGAKFKTRDIKLQDKLMSGPVNPAFYKICVKAKPFHVAGSCIGCGRCEKLCPLNNISMKDGKPIWGKNCTHCMACIAHCPTTAIEYGRKSKGKARYHLD